MGQNIGLRPIVNSVTTSCSIIWYLFYGGLPWKLIKSKTLKVQGFPSSVEVLVRMTKTSYEERVCWFPVWGGKPPHTVETILFGGYSRGGLEPLALFSKFDPLVALGFGTSFEEKGVSWFSVLREQPHDTIETMLSYDQSECGFGHLGPF